MAGKEKKVQALYNSFVFIGEVIFNEEKNYKTAVSKESGYKYSRIQIGLKTADGNVVYTDLMGGFSTTKKNTIYSMDKEKNRLEIDFNDRNDAKILESVADFKKLKVNLESTDEKDAKVFIAEYDMVEYLKNNLKKGVRVVMTGNVSIERYKNNDGNYQTLTKYVPTKIRLAKEDEVNKAELKLNFVFDNESLETDRYEKEGKIDITGFFTTYNKDLKQNVFVQIPLVVDMNYLASLRSLTDEQKTMISDLIKGYFKAKAGEYIETEWRADLFKGTQREEITIEDLSPEQKMQLESGWVTLEQLQKEMASNKNGDKINEIKLVSPTSKFRDEKDMAMVNRVTDLTEDDFIIPEVKVEDKKEVFNTPKVEDEKSEQEVLKGLFG